MLMAALAACGGNNAAPEPTAIAEAPTVAAEPTDAPPAAEPTDAPPTAAPTEAPTAEPTEEPAAEPETGELVLTGECANPFFPVVEGRTYHYNSYLEGFGESSYSITFSNVTDTSFTHTFTPGDEDISITTTWTCRDGGLLAPEFGGFTDLLEGMTFEFVEADGLTMPGEGDFFPGATWTTHYVANATMPDMGIGPITMVETIDMTHKVIGTEAVSVPYGDFPDAWRVEMTGTVTVAMSAGGVEQNGSAMPVNSVSWYVKDIGLVKQITTDTDFIGEGDGATELVAIDN